MKLVAFHSGRKNGNTEVFVKEALMAAEEMGIEVELYRLNEFEFTNCTACQGFCPPEIDACPHSKDEARVLVEAFLNSDGVIIASPCYSLTPNSLFYAFRDRVFGPKMDVSTVWELGFPEPSFAKGRFKTRPGGLIGVGGTLTENWTSLNIPGLFSATFSAQTDVVDHMNAYGVADATHAAISDKWLERAHNLGKHVAEAMLSGDHSWRGEDEGTCPLCHENMLLVTPGTNQICCPVCGITGTIEVVDGVIQTTWPDDWEHSKDNRLSPKGKRTHMEEIDACAAAFEPRKEEAKEKMKKYLNYTACEMKSPAKEARKAELLEKYGKKDS